MVLPLLLLLTAPLQDAAAPELTAAASRPSVQKGGVFEITVRIAAKAPLKNIAIAPLVPYGFALVPVANLGLTTDTVTGVVQLAELGGASDVTVLYHVSTPNILGRSPDKNAHGPVSTAEAKQFTFNVAYVLAEHPARQSVAVSVGYTTNLALYLISGLFGAALGTLIKNGVRKRKEVAEATETHKGLRKQVVRVRTLFGLSLSALTISLTIAFGVLLVLAKDGIPISGWHQAVALGIGLAVLTDDQLLTKIG